MTWEEQPYNPDVRQAVTPPQSYAGAAPYVPGVSAPPAGVTYGVMGPNGYGVEVPWPNMSQPGGAPANQPATAATAPIPSPQQKSFADAMRAIVQRKPRGSYGRGAKHSEKYTYAPGGRELLDFTKMVGWNNGLSLQAAEQKFIDLLKTKGIAYSPDLQTVFHSRYQGGLLGGARKAGLPSVTPEWAKTNYGGLDLATQQGWTDVLNQRLGRLAAVRPAGMGATYAAAPHGTKLGVSTGSLPSIMR